MSRVPGALDIGPLGKTQRRWRRSSPEPRAPDAPEFDPLPGDPPVGVLSAPLRSSSGTRQERRPAPRSYAFRAGRKATQPFEDVETDDEDENRASSKATARALPWGVFAGEFAKSPLSGPGMGLPLSRLYARYLGGTLEVIS